MAIGFMSFGGMLTGDEGNKKEVKESAEHIDEDAPKLAENTNTTLVK